MADMTLEELEKEDGQEGRGTLVAAHGRVYDVGGSALWKGGRHMGAHQAGADLTAELADAPHGEEVFERVREAGRLVERKAGKAEPARELPAWAEKLIALHSHPISAHFPQAFFVFAPVFLALFYVSGNPGFERTAFHTLSAGFLMAFPGALTGLVHWWYKYGGKARPVFKLKIALSVLLLALAGAGVLLHFSAGTLSPDALHWGVIALYVLLLPVITLLGRAGGQIVFGGKGR